MTESEWWSAADGKYHSGTSRATRLIDWVYSDARACDRKLRLFCLACCQRVKQFLPLWPRSKYLDLLEDYADGRIDRDALLKHVNPADHVIICPGPEGLDPDGVYDTYSSLSAQDQVLYQSCSSKTFDLAMRHDYPHRHTYPRQVSLATALDLPSLSPSYYAELAAHVRSFHDIFGPLPFRDIAVQPPWLTSDVLLLARGIYAEKAFDRMPILADALQDAGCENTDILNHCRAEGWEHVRGCWVIDLLLGKTWRET